MLDQVYSIALKRKDVIDFKHQQFKVTPIVYRECVLFTRLHAIIIGVMSVLALAISSLNNDLNVFRDIIYVIIFLVMANLLLDRLFYFLLFRRCKNG